MQLDIVTLHHYNDIISTTVGALANILAIYIVRSRTRRELRQYSKTLIQNLFIDLLFNAAVFISKVQVEVYDGLMIFMLGGFASDIKHPWDHLFHMSYVYFVYFSVMAMVVPFYCRYRVFCKADVLSNYRIGVLYFYAALLAFCHNFIFAFSMIPNPDVIDRVCKVLNNSIFMRSNGKLPTFIACSIKSPMCLAMVGSCSLVFAVAYGLIAHFGIKINKKMVEQGENWNVKTRNFHWEINRALILQAVTPLFASVIPIVCAILIVLVQINIHGIVLVASMTISWACVLNPFIVLASVTIYRQACLKPEKYLCGRHKISPQNSSTSSWSQHIIVRPRLPVKSVLYAIDN